MLMSGSTITRPARSSVAPGRVRPAPCPAARRARPPPTAPCARRCARAVPFIVTVTPSGIDLRDASAGARAHAERDQLLLGLRRKVRREASAERAVRPPPAGSAASRGSMWRKSCRSVSLAISPSAPASSTPVGPPPTITKFSHARRSSASVRARRARTPAAARLRISVASSMVFSPGATAPTGRCRSSGASRRWPRSA